MAEPILIVHGVANHEPESFMQSVRELQQQLGAQWELIPVFWGDLGGASDDIADCLPVLKVQGWGVRSKPDNQYTQPTRVEVGGGTLPNVARAQIIAATATASSGKSVRSEASHEAVAEIIEDELPQTTVLQYVDDIELLGELGELIRVVVEESNISESHTMSSVAQHEVRSLGDMASEVRGLTTSLTERVKKVIQSADSIIGRFLGNRLGQINQNIRGAVAGPFAGFCGDIIVYQRNQLQIQKRIWEALERHGQGYGTEDKPVHAIAHSLGGVITFDTAIEANIDGQQLWLKSLTTFGSQAAFFHIIDQRRSLSKYRRNEPVKLPASIGKWINLWDTLDFLAFTAGTIFRLHDGSKPEDIAVLDPLSNLIQERAWTHSIYWKSEELMSALQKVLNS